MVILLEIWIFAVNVIVLYVALVLDILVMIIIFLVLGAVIKGNLFMYIFVIVSIVGGDNDKNVITDFKNIDNDMILHERNSDICKLMEIEIFQNFGPF